MAEDYYKAAGVLMLDHVTPVIRALFSIFTLRETFDGMRESYVGIAQKHPPVLWGELLAHLTCFAQWLGCPLPSNATIDIKTCLDLLSTHFQVEQGHVDELIARLDPSKPVYLDDVFLLATHFDDGHGLMAIEITGARYCTEPQLFALSCNSMYICREMVLRTSSTTASTLGGTIHTALHQGNIRDAANGLVLGVESIFFRAFRDEALRDTLREQLAIELLNRSINQRKPTNGPQRLN